MSMEETFTDKEFCTKWKIDRATSARWRDEGIVGFIKLPNGQIRYLQSHIEALKTRFENGRSAVKGSVIDIGVAKRGGDVRVS
jgi:predicted site-specific integrase-resolvase